MSARLGWHEGASATTPILARAGRTLEICALVNASLISGRAEVWYSSTGGSHTVGYTTLSRWQRNARLCQASESAKPAQRALRKPGPTSASGRSSRGCSPRRRHTPIPAPRIVRYQRSHWREAPLCAALLQRAAAIRAAVRRCVRHRLQALAKIDGCCSKRAGVERAQRVFSLRGSDGGSITPPCISPPREQRRWEIPMRLRLKPNRSSPPAATLGAPCERPIRRGCVLDRCIVVGAAAARAVSRHRARRRRRANQPAQL